MARKAPWRQPPPLPWRQPPPPPWRQPPSPGIPPRRRWPPPPPLPPPELSRRHPPRIRPPHAGRPRPPPPPPRPPPPPPLPPRRLSSFFRRKDVSWIPAILDDALDVCQRALLNDAVAGPRLEWQVVERLQPILRLLGQGILPYNLRSRIRCVLAVLGSRRWSGHAIRDLGLRLLV